MSPVEASMLCVSKVVVAAGTFTLSSWPTSTSQLSHKNLQKRGAVDIFVATPILYMHREGWTGSKLFAREV
jgi:hypothetical protein